jgi:uncharacterized protein (TIGR04255 family)
VHTAAMDQFPHLSKAPILEATIEIRVATANPVDISAFDAAVRELKDELPVQQMIQLVSSTLALGPDGKAEHQTSATPAGVRLDSRDQVRAIQMRPDLIAVSRVREYSRWSDLLELTERAWKLYAEAVRPTAVTRLGVRYINRILLRDAGDLDQVLTAAPRIPPNLPQLIAGFNSRIVVPMQDCGVLISQTNETAAASDGSVQAALMLDIDAFTESVPVDWGAIASKLEGLRYAKNLAFFSSLQPQVLEAYK